MPSTPQIPDMNPSLPLPGQHTGRRLLQIEDLQPAIWNQHAYELGRDWAEELGAASSETGWTISAPDVFRARVVDRLPPGLALLPATESAPGLPLNGALEDRPLTIAGLDRFRAGKTTTIAPIVSARGVVPFPVRTWGSGVAESSVDLNAEASPALFIIQVIGISSFLGDYGPGRTVKVLSLLPGETMTISTRTWRSFSSVASKASSIIDSFDESSSERFADTVLRETTDASTREKTENWHVEAEARASIAIAGAKVSGGGGGEYSSSTEEFAKSLDEAVREHAAEASSHRENSVTSSSEWSEATETEEATERTIRNINVRRTLSFVFREMNQAYITKTHIKDVRIAFSNGRAGSWFEVPVSGLRGLVESVVLPEHVDKICSDIIGTIAVLRDRDGAPVKVLEEVTLDQCGQNATARAAEPDANCVYAPPTSDGRGYYRFRRGTPLGQSEDESFPVEGVLLTSRQIVMATDSVVVDAMLGREDALDEYSHDLQIETIRAQRLANDQSELSLDIVRQADAVRAELLERLNQEPETGGG